MHGSNSLKSTISKLKLINLVAVCFQLILVTQRLYLSCHKQNNGYKSLIKIVSILILMYVYFVAAILLHYVLCIYAHGPYSPASTRRLNNVVSTSMQRHDVASTLRRRCIDVMCLLGGLLH